MEPSYLELYREGELEIRAEKALGLLKSCNLCPRACGVNRLAGETGYCRTGRKARVASYNAHFGEEAPLVGEYGSGTIFLSSCNLLCTFCQNYDISHLSEGVEIEPDQMAAMMIQLAERDKRVNESWPEYEADLKANGVEYTLHMYPECNHGFHNDSTGRYNEEMAELAWKRTLEFFKQHLL